MKRILTLFVITTVIIYLCWVFSPQTKPPKGIILISLDTLRADHLGTYGYQRNTSPFNDAFAKENIIFKNAVVQAPTTLPSHMSIMTSLYPSYHGTGLKKRLADKHVTLAELLREGGYRTAAFTDGVQMRSVFGFDQGFDIYDGERRIGIARILPKVKKWLNKNKSDLFFLFIHCYDIHGPYDPPPPYNSIFHDSTYTGNLIPNYKTFNAISKNGLEVNDEDIQHFIALYDGGIRYTDEKLGGFLSYLRDSGLENESLIIITSDHGEEFMEHGSFRHWQLYYRPNLHVPLVMRVPNYPKKEIIINELVQSIDLLPTILEIAGLPSHPKAQGRSLLPLIERQKNFLSRSLWKVLHLFKKTSNTSFAEFANYNCSVIADGYQMIYNLASHSIQIFDIGADPLAQNNIAKDRDNISERMLSQIKKFYSRIPSDKAPPITLDEQTREQLKALGYIQ